MSGRGQPRGRARGRDARTFDGRTGRVLGDASAPAATDYVDFGLNPSDTGWSDTGAPAGTDAGGSAATLPAVTVSATPLSGGLSATLASVPWWVWVLLGLGGGYFIARQYGHKIGRALAPAG